MRTRSSTWLVTVAVDGMFPKSASGTYVQRRHRGVAGRFDGRKTHNDTHTISDYPPYPFSVLIPHRITTYDKGMQLFAIPSYRAKMRCPLCFGRFLGGDKSVWGSRGRRFKSCRPDCFQKEALRRERRRAFSLWGRGLRRRVGSSKTRFRAFDAATGTAATLTKPYQTRPRLRRLAPLRVPPKM